MKGTRFSIFAALIIGTAFMIFGSTSSVYAQEDNPIAPVLDTNVIKPQPVCDSTTPTAISVSAPICEMLGSKIYARGTLIFTKGKERISATDVMYDVNTERGSARNVFFTTCTAVRPDYHIVAREVFLRPNQRLYAKNVALYLGRTRVLVLPAMKLNVGGRSSTSSIFPRPGYNSRDGVTLSQTFRLTDTSHSITAMNLIFTTLHSIEGDITSRYGIGGRLVSLPGRYLTYGSMRSRVLNAPQQPDTTCDPQLLRPKDAAHLQPFGMFTLRQRTYDARNLGLVVYKQPEMGVAYIGDQLSLKKKKLDPRIEIYPQITASWGRFKETPGLVNYMVRNQIAMQGAFNAVWLGPSTSIQPLGIVTYANYGDGQNFRTWGYGIDAAHITQNGSFYSARYINRTSSGSTPFLFDNIDISEEIDLAAQTHIGRHVYGLVMTYDAQTGSLFDWEVMYGRRTDCLGTYIRWDNRFQKFSFDVTLINL